MPGQIINLLSSDMNTFIDFFYLTHHIFVVPIQTIIVLYITYREIGISAFIGSTLIFLFIPIHYICGRVISKYRIKTFVRRDERIRLMTEIIEGINIIKMYAWEKPFASIISKCRKLEIDSITMSSYIRGAFSLHFVFITTSIFVSIISTSLFGTTISAKSAFIITTLYNSFGFSFMLFLPQGITSIEESKVSVKRIQDFLLSPEVEVNDLSDKSDHAIVIENGSAKWDQATDQYTFLNLNCKIKAGCLIAVVGPVGSGKSSLLHVLLQELSLLSGKIHVNGTLSYASQEPWIFSASIRRNILFGSKINEERYRKVVTCCALNHDFKLFPYGDTTIVGERGASLSGGQKARINLARAIYREADVYLLDDPLSAVDTHVGKEIFEKCIQGFLKNKTVVLITHQLQYLKYVDHIIVLDNGLVAVEGAPAELETTGFNFAQYLKNYEDEENQVAAINKKLLVDDIATNRAPKAQPEAQITGNVPFTIYKDYILASKSYGFALFAFSCFAFTQLFTSASYYFVAYWVKMERQSYLESNDNQRQLNTYIYSAITLGSIIFTVMRVFSYIKISMRSSQVLHDSMLDKVVHAPLKFFNSNSSGRILNRFAKDLGTIDDVLPATAIITIRTLFSALGIVLVICVVNQWFIIPTAVVVILVYFMRKVYLITNLCIMRVEGITRSPVYGHANTSLQGLATIRAFHVEQILADEFYFFQDKRNSAYYLSITISRSFAYFSDWICFIYMTVLTLYFTLNQGSTGEKIGLAITQAFQLIGLLPWGIRHLSEVEGHMISVERVLEYSSIEKERHLNSTSVELPSVWPERGEIKFSQVYLRYSENEPYVLKNLNFVIKPREKIGIVGRTGAGKSSIVTLLFQLEEHEGLITIDDVDVKKINLQKLRKSMSIIPQDPVLFSGTVRKNLDPFDEYEDDVLWKALEEVRLKEVVDSMGSGLSSKILQSGSNLSVGQRQLICLARAIIRNNKILILDEATANVDLKTDEIIQETIRSNFINCTVLTVAHRLNTIMDSDRVLVMDSGEVVEFDHSYVLLQNKDGIFYNMVQQTEQATAKVLIDASHKNYQQTIGKDRV